MEENKSMFSSSQMTTHFHNVLKCPESCCSVAKTCLTLCDPMDCSMPGSLLGSSAHGISQAKILEWVVTSLSRGSLQPRDQAYVSCIGRWVLYHWATSEAQSVRFSAYKCCEMVYVHTLAELGHLLSLPMSASPLHSFCDPLAVSWQVYTCFHFIAFVPEVPSEWNLRLLHSGCL